MADVEIPEHIIIYKEYFRIGIPHIVKCNYCEKSIEVEYPFNENSFIFGRISDIMAIIDNFIQLHKDCKKMESTKE